MDTPIRRLISRDAPICVTGPTQTAADAVANMHAMGVSYTLVVDRGRPHGILTRGDIMTRVMAMTRDLCQVIVADVMSRPVVCIGPHLTVGDGLHLMSEGGFRRLPVVDDDTVLGMVSAVRLLRWVSRDLEQALDDLSCYIAGPSTVPPPPRAASEWARLDEL